MTAAEASTPVTGFTANGFALHGLGFTKAAPNR